MNGIYLLDLIAFLVAAFWIANELDRYEDGLMEEWHPDDAEVLGRIEDQKEYEHYYEDDEPYDQEKERER